MSFIEFDFFWSVKRLYVFLHIDHFHFLQSKLFIFSLSLTVNTFNKASLFVVEFGLCLQKATLIYPVNEFRICGFGRRFDFPTGFAALIFGSQQFVLVIVGFMAAHIVVGKVGSHKIIAAGRTSYAPRLFNAGI